jgi:outer membrane protein OmpA-like peptidoglycan-associated protein
MSEETRALTNEAREGLSAFRDNMEALQHNFLLRGFFEKRGYNDTGELTQHSISRLPARTPAKEFNYEPKDIFDKSDNAKLKNKKPLDDAGKFLEENPFGLAVVASSEAKGDTDKLRVLTEARAKVVRDYLTQNFKLDDKRVKTIGLGKTKKVDGASRLLILVYPSAASAQRSSPSGQ